MCCIKFCWLKYGRVGLRYLQLVCPQPLRLYRTLPLDSRFAGLPVASVRHVPRCARLPSVPRSARTGRRGSALATHHQLEPPSVVVARTIRLRHYLWASLDLCFARSGGCGPSFLGRGQRVGAGRGA